MDPLHPLYRSNGIPSVKYEYKKIVRAFVSSTPAYLCTDSEGIMSPDPTLKISQVLVL